MRIPPRAIKCNEMLNEIDDLMKYFLPEGAELSRIRNNINHLQEYIVELSQEKKVNDIKLAAKIKKGLKEQ